MKNSIILKTILLISGIILVAAGIGAFQTPGEIATTQGLKLGAHASFISNALVAQLLMLIGGSWIILGAVFQKLSFVSTLLSSIIYLSFCLSQISAITLNGMDSESAATDAFVQAVIGLTAVFALILYSTDTKNSKDVSSLELE